MRDDVRYNVELRDVAAGQELGLILDDPGDVLGYRRALVNPYAAKAATGDTGYHDLTDWSMAVFADWTAGRGYEEEGVAGGYFDGHGVETRIAGQLTLGPLAQVALAGDPEHVPGSVTEYVLGYPGGIAYEQATQTWTGIEATRQQAQQFVVPDGGQWWIVSFVFKMCKHGTGHAGNVIAGLWSDVDGEPGSVLTSVEVAHGDFHGDTLTEETFTFTAPYSLTAGASYWLVLDHNSVGEFLYQYNRTGAYEGESAFRYTPLHAWHLTAGWDLWFKVGWAQLSLEQSFTTAAPGLNSQTVQLYGRRLGTPGDITVALYDDDGGGNPDSQLKTDTITAGQLKSVAGWFSASWDTEVLDGGTVYHIVLSTPGTPDDPGVCYLIGGDADTGYGGGAAQYKLGSGSWAVLGADLYFRAFDSSGRTSVVLDGNPIAFKRFNGAWYCAAGDTVYKWNTSNHNWDTSEASAGNDITGMAVWDGFLWVARGTATNVRKMNTSSEWADAGFEGELLYAGGHVQGGWLHIQDADSAHQFRYTSDGTTLSDPFEVGSPDYSITGFAWMRDIMVIATTVGLYGFGAQMVYQLFDWRSMEYEDNGKALFAWGRDGALYIPLLYGLYRWNGDTQRAVGPEQGAPEDLENVFGLGPPGGLVYTITKDAPGWVPVPGRLRRRGMPAGRAGAIRALWGTANWLYAAIEGGSGRTSSVMATDGMHGWHEIVRADTTDEVLVGLGYETLSAPPRLWYGLGVETRFVEMPDYSDNPYLWPGLSFRASGEITTPWVGTDLVEVVKDFHQVVIRGESMTSGQAVEVWYEVDRSDRWLLLGEVQQSPRQVLRFTSSVFASKVVGSGSTTTIIELDTGTVGDLSAGTWVRIGSEVAQVATVTWPTTFTLEMALSEAPRPGDCVYASRPAGRELRLKLILKTDDATLTPKIDAVLLQFQPNVIDRWSWMLAIQCRNRMKGLCGGQLEGTAAELRQELASWAMRLTPFVFVDIDGTEWTVKLSAATERAVVAVRRGDAGVVYDSVWDMVLLQVQ